MYIYVFATTYIMQINVIFLNNIYLYELIETLSQYMDHPIYKKVRQ